MAANIYLNVPPWAGKALGAAAALVFAPPHPGSVLWWLTAGIALGHGFDSLGHHATPPGPAEARDDGHPHGQASLRYTFAAMGRIAAAAGDSGAGADDFGACAGDFSAAHLSYAERLMARLAFTVERRRQALAWFHAGRDAAFPFDTLAGPCRSAFAAHPVLQELARQSLCRMAALTDSPRATRELLALGERLGWDRDGLAAQAVAIGSFLADDDATARAREVLGVQRHDGPEAIRLAYRRRVARWHPDRLAPEATPEERAAADRRMWQLREALERLLGSRG